MGVYKVKIAGRDEPILMRAKGRPEAIGRIVEEAKALTAEEVEEAFARGDSVWREGEPFPAELPGDVRRLVIAARIVTDAGTETEDVRALLDAVEPFSSRVPYQDQPA